ncbi:3'(2'),5'-bisphosphate nucleotidase CysQ [Roseibium limicola]|uniref:3'(2'),5'-bisphosphate nucleotidase CysQ n=1 Tax=Roseibium limicola TaxID=2816037 RepID=A0A939J5J1_9HYPH|nr:3'(2'),5'-bisphosphate nucleotidase CysQ [Roseibium limicola]MBO0345875.1 3'(2'),5'-bisphosphate nucleotidase CysQ [Roseibium limicola]
MPEADRTEAQIADLKADLALLEGAARQAGALALGYFGRDPRNWLKEGKSPVSEADLAVDKLLAEVLLRARPDYGWLSEETADTPDRLSRSRAFIVDPIDGTRAFLAGGEEWTIALAVVEDGMPQTGAVFCPVRDEMFLAARGLGVTLNGAPIQASDRPSVQGASLTGPHSIVANAGVQAAGFERSENLRSLAYRIAMVAVGRVDVAAARPNANDWDLAAADLLVQEAGGRLTDFTGAGLMYNQRSTRHPALLAAPLQLVDPARAVLSEQVG